MGAARASRLVSPLPPHLVLCQVTLGGGTGGCGRHHDRDGTFRVPAAVFVRPPPSLTLCLCVVLLGAVPQTSCPICCSCRVYIYIYIFALIVRRLAATSPDSLTAWRWWSGALTVVCRTVFDGWRAPRGAGECGLLGNCGWIGCFSQPQCHSRYSSPFPSPLRHVFPPSSRTSLMGQPPTVARGARHCRRPRPPSRSFK